MSAYETCYACRGSGHQMGYFDALRTCGVCGGDCVIRKRDSRGRFVKGDVLHEGASRVTGYVWADDPERHLAGWADQPGHAVEYVSTHNLWWWCTAKDDGTQQVFVGRGPTRADAAYDALTKLAVHALEQARAQQQAP